jgi:tetratricopeptide (TPR) repeat protein
MHRSCWPIALLLVPLAAGCAPKPGPEELRLFVKAQDTFDQANGREDFLRAAAMYQEILDRGFRSGAVFYNQANALVQGGQRGRAIAAYRQAIRCRPRDPYLQANLRYALGSDSAAGRRSLLAYLLFWQDWLSYLEKFQCLAALAVLAAALGLLGLVLRRVWVSRLAAVGLALTLVMGVSAAYDWHRYEQVRHGVVVAPKTIARKGNAASYQPALTAPLEEGTEFVVLERRGEWLWIQLPGGQEGWVEDPAVATY